MFIMTLPSAGGNTPWHTMWYGQCAPNTTHVDTVHMSCETSHPHLWRHYIFSWYIRMCRIHKSMLDSFINELVTKLCSKSQRGWMTLSNSTWLVQEWVNLDGLAWDCRRQNKTVYDEIISTVPIRLIRALNTYSMRTTWVCGMHYTTFSWKNRKKKKRDNFFKTIFHHDPEHLGQVWVVCMQFRHSRAGLHTQNGVKRTTTARNMASNVNGPCFEAKSQRWRRGHIFGRLYLRSNITFLNIWKWMHV